METCGAVPTTKSVGEILWCDHSNEMSMTIRLHFSIFYKNNFLDFRHS